MDKQLCAYSIDELRDIAKQMELNQAGDKSALITRIVHALNKYEQYKAEKIDKYTRINQLGTKGKEGTTYLVKTKGGKEYAMKTFRSNKPSDKMREEIRLQMMAADSGVSPKIIDYDTVSKFVVMEKMDGHLMDHNGKGKVLGEPAQRQIIDIFDKLDRAKVFHGDANLLNYMLKAGKVYMIDFGFSKEIDDKLIRKLKTSRPNSDIMLLGLIIKLKECEYDSRSYSILKTKLSKEKQELYKL